MVEPADMAQQPMSLEEARIFFPPMWTIYDHPKDYPHHFVVRRWYGLTPDYAAQCDTLGEARQYIADQGGCVALKRDEHDDPVIIETWL
jgi:hypothetical protein